MRNRDSLDERGVGGAWTRFQRHDHAEPAADLAPFVERYWSVDWHYERPYEQLIVPYPKVHLTLHPGMAAEVHGVSSGPVVKVLAGRSSVFGVEFRPGGFRPFLGSSVTALTDRVVGATEIPGLPAPAPVEPVDVASVENWLRFALPPVDPDALRAADVVAAVAADPTIMRVDRLAEHCATSVRALQRLFAEYVGVGPKWVIRRYRLHEVTERMAAGTAADWAGLAADLGYADQAHFTRDFTSMFGEPPSRYVQRYPAPPMSTEPPPSTRGG